MTTSPEPTDADRPQEVTDFLASGETVRIVQKGDETTILTKLDRVSLYEYLERLNNQVFKGVGKEGYTADLEWVEQEEIETGDNLWVAMFRMGIF